MAQIINIPTQSTSSIVSVTLGGSVFVFTFTWLNRVGKWTVSISDSNEEPIIQGVSIMVDTELTGRYPEVVEKMKGELWFIKNPDSLSDKIDKGNVNEDYSLMYVPIQEG